MSEYTNKVDSIVEKLTRIAQYKDFIRLAVNNKGGEIDQSTVLRQYPEKILNMSAGGDFAAAAENGLAAYYSDTTAATKIATRFWQYASIRSASYPNASMVESWAFYGCSSISYASFPVCTYAGSNAFRGCYSMSTMFMPLLERVREATFEDCSALTSATFLSCTVVEEDGFGYCSSLRVLDLGICSRIYEYAFENCTSLSSLYLRSSLVCTLSNSNAFQYTSYKNSSATGRYIYVPSSLVSQYKSKTNWVYFSSKIRSIPS